MDNIDYEEYNRDNTEEMEIKTKEDIIIELERQITKFDDMVDYLWENIIMKNNNNILNKLTENDKDKFYIFMFNNSSAIQTVKNELNKLMHQK